MANNTHEARNRAIKKLRDRYKGLITVKTAEGILDKVKSIIENPVILTNHINSTIRSNIKSDNISYPATPERAVGLISAIRKISSKAGWDTINNFPTLEQTYQRALRNPKVKLPRLLPNIFDTLVDSIISTNYDIRGNEKDIIKIGSRISPYFLDANINGITSDIDFGYLFSDIAGKATDKWNLEMLAAKEEYPWFYQSPKAREVIDQFKTKFTAYLPEINWDKELSELNHMEWQDSWFSSASGHIGWDDLYNEASKQETLHQPEQMKVILSRYLDAVFSVEGKISYEEILEDAIRNFNSSSNPRTQTMAKMLNMQDLFDPKPERYLVTALKRQKDFALEYINDELNT